MLVMWMCTLQTSLLSHKLYFPRNRRRKRASKIEQPAEVALKSRDKNVKKLELKLNRGFCAAMGVNALR